MAQLNLIGQASRANAFRNQRDTFLSDLQIRAEVYRRLPPDKQKAWRENDKDPLICMAWQTLQQLAKFFEVEIHGL